MRTDNTISLISSIREHANKYIVTELERRGHKGLAPSHGNILSVLLFKGEMTKKQISKAIDKDRSTVTVLLRKLEQLGYITSRVNEADSRSSIVSVTNKGQVMKSDFIAISEGLYHIQYKDMNENQIQVLKAMLKQMEINFRAVLED